MNHRGGNVKWVIKNEQNFDKLGKKFGSREKRTMWARDRCSSEHGTCERQWGDVLIAISIQMES